MSRPLLPLSPPQRAATDPLSSAWVMASAGSGKTQVLAARVLRLLLDGVPPQSILCLTFTKAAAAEMTERVLGRLAEWAMAEDPVIHDAFAALGHPVTPAAVARARALFAQVLETEGGLAIQTIHAFAQSVLARFPLEAGIAPGFSTLDEITAARLSSDAREILFALALKPDEAALAADLRQLAILADENNLESLLLKVRAAVSGLSNLALAGILPRLRRLLGLPAQGSAQSLLAARLSDDAFDVAAVRHLMQVWRGWKATTAQKLLEGAQGWLAGDAQARARDLDRLAALVLTKDGEPHRNKHLPKNPGDEDAAAMERLAAAVRALLEMRSALKVAENSAMLIRVAARYDALIEQRKSTAGLLDFDDLILRLEKLFARPDVRDWVCYKLGGRIAHVLIDEGQDTNRAQWRIIDALTEEFFAGEGAAHSLFAVGDVKQSIYRFQGAEPAAFLDARERYRAAARAARARFSDVPLNTSYRSAPAVLRLVDAWLEQVGHEALGLDAAPLPHEAHRAGDAGRVVLWPAIAYEARDTAREWSPSDEMDWQPTGPRLMARQVARQIADWVRGGAWLAARNRRLRWGDIMVLVRARSEFNTSLIAELKGTGVPVAGADRTALKEPLAVQDLIALIRFVLAPQGDLSLAVVLRSPLLGWTDEALFELAHGREKRPLWSCLIERAGDWAQAGTALAFLEACRAAGSGSSAFWLLETVLGPLDGMARLVARLGAEAREPVEELVSQALAFEGRGTPSLQGFLAWFDSTSAESRRQSDAPADMVRILTIHGAKGLQAPVVIMADAFSVPDQTGDGFVMLEDAGGPLPLWFARKAEAVGAMAVALGKERALTLAEHWRLLYVGLTRAEDTLVIGGWMPGKAASANGLPRWHIAVEQAMRAAGAAEEEDERWGRTLVLADAPARAPVCELAPVAQPDTDASPALPAWSRVAAPPEPAPPRPLAPSRLEVERPADSPRVFANPQARQAGVLAHGLLEHLPGLSPFIRVEVARRWLAREVPDWPDDARERLAADVLAVLDDPTFAPVFAEDALAEAPVSAVIGAHVLAGSIDRLVVLADRVLAVDYKTGQQVPDAPEAVPPVYLRQMALYGQALERIYPGRQVEAALLWTARPLLMRLPAALLAPYRLAD